MTWSEWRRQRPSYSGKSEHYLTTPDNERVIIGVAENDGGKCHTVWSAIEVIDVEV